MRKISILGSTGSIGTQTLEIVRANKDIQVLALAAGSNIDSMEMQAREFRPKLVAMWSKEAAKDLEIRLADTDIKVCSGMEGLMEVACFDEVETVVTALVGMIGIRPTIAAIESGKDIALANKETLVTAGHIIMPLAKKKRVSILPVDSEHSAIFQSLNGEESSKIEKILLTASGGPFRNKTLKDLENIQVEDALKHPNWVMGRKITIDSSTLINKGLEVIEAKWLFDVEMSQIEVVVHPQSVIHSMVQFVDGSVMAQLGTPDMKLPIQYALYYPNRMPLAGQRLDFAKLGTMSFEQANTDVFFGLRLAYEAGNLGGSMPTVFNAANEKLVEMFLEKKLSYLDIPRRIEHCMASHSVIANPSLEEILAIEQEIYHKLRER